MPAILEAVDRLNELASAEVYTVRAVDSERRVDDQVVVRVGDAGEDAYGPRLAATRRTGSGVALTLASTRATPHTAAHELGHAAGLKHVDDPANLMYFDGARLGWKLEPSQLDAIRGAH